MNPSFTEDYPPAPTPAGTGPQNCIDQPINSQILGRWARDNRLAHSPSFSGYEAQLMHREPSLAFEIPSSDGFSLSPPHFRFQLQGTPK